MNSYPKISLKLWLSVAFFFVATVCDAQVDNHNPDTLAVQSDTVVRNDLKRLEKEAAAYMKRFRYKEAAERLNEYTVLYLRNNLPEGVGKGNFAPLKKTFLTMVQCYKKLNMFNEAIGVLNGIYAADTTDLQVMGELADCFLLAADYVGCAGIYTKMLEQDSTNTYFEYQRALVNVKGEYWDDALEGFTNLYRRGDSTNNVILRLLGDCYFNTGDGGNTLHFYDRAIRAKPTDQLAVRKISLLYLNLQQGGLALKYTSDYIALDSTNIEVNRLNGIARYVTRDFHGAVDVLGKLIERENDDAYFTNYYYGLSLSALSRFSEAVVPLTVAYQYDTTNIEVIYRLGDACCRALSMESKGIKLLKSGLEFMRPKKMDLFRYHVSIAQGYAGLRDYDNAIKSMNLAKINNPKYTEAFYHIATYYYYKKKEKEKAAEYYRLYLKYGKNNTLRSLAKLKFKDLQEDLFMEGIEIKPLEDYVPENKAKDTTVVVTEKNDAVAK